MKTMNKKENIAGDMIKYYLSEHNDWSWFGGTVRVEDNTEKQEIDGLWHILLTYARWQEDHLNKEEVAKLIAKVKADFSATLKKRGRMQKCRLTAEHLFMLAAEMINEREETKAEENARLRMEEDLAREIYYRDMPGNHLTMADLEKLYL